MSFKEFLKYCYVSKTDGTHIPVFDEMNVLQKKQIEMLDNGYIPEIFHGRCGRKLIWIKK